MPITQNLFNNSAPTRGELWISGELLCELGLEKTQQSIIDISSSIGADICFLSYTSPVQPLSINSEQMSLLVQRAHNLNLACGVTIDGPFERTAREHGLIEVMKWFYKTGQLEKHLEKNTMMAVEELHAAEKAGADMFILCDDIAYTKGLYFSPEQFKNILLPYYRNLKKSIKGDKPIGFHSDGNIQPIIGTLIDSGYSYFSIEPEALPLDELLTGLPEHVSVLSGIKAEWLMGPDSIDSKIHEIIQFIQNIKNHYGRKIILGSSCGIADIQSLERLKVIYGILDEK